MRGEVEIWKGNTLLYKDSNMLADGAGELLADIMTVSPSLSGIEDHATSSILDTSNYTIQAISFGTGAHAFRDNAYKSGSLQDATNAVKLPNENETNSYVSLTYEGDIENFDGSAYRPVVGVPIAPDPSLKTLELDTSVSSEVSGIAVSSVIPGNGQLLNFLPSAIYSATFEGGPFDNGLSGYTASRYLGAFSNGSSTAETTHVTVNKGGSTVFSPFFQGVGTGSFFNEVSSMDVSGFVNMVMSGSPGTTTGYGMSSTASGLCVSGGHKHTSLTIQFTEPFGTVEYSVQLSKNDIITTNVYGGIYHLGLWTIDMQKSLLNGNTPPFAFSVLNNPRKYKLFARKGLSKNLGWIDQHSTISPALNEHSDLTIKWRLHFL